jgi:hypothetical protein
MNTPDPTPSDPADLPPAPWILLDRTTVEQAAAALARLEGWLTGGDPSATADCAHACSSGEDDAVAVARWVGTLADLLRHRVEEVSSWS